jgi:LmbE family N-acetylglucosaminyl deacetylase
MICEPTPVEKSRMKANKTVIFSPHPDDETLACGGTIAKRTYEGNEVFIVVMTDGRHAFSKLLNITTDPSPDELKQMRRQELINALRILGVPKANLFFLDFEDGALKENLRAAEERVTLILKATLPAEVYLPHSQDDHQDHRATNRIVRNSIARTGLKARRFQFSVYRKKLRLKRAMDTFVNVFKHNIVRVDVKKKGDNGVQERNINHK